jgi:hypothetical protein
MVTAIVVATVVILVLIAISRTIYKDHTTLLIGPSRQTSTPLLSAEMKRQIEETESDIRVKSETVARIIAEKQGPPSKKKTEVSTDPLNETSFMRAISAKVEKVKRISGV